MKLVIRAMAVAVALLFTCTTLYCADFCSKHLANLNQTSHATEAALHAARILRATPMREFLESQGKRFTGSSEVFLFELEGGLRAVWKVDGNGKRTDAEITAYRLSEFLGLAIVPPTVRRNYLGRAGSLQLYVATTRDLARDGSLAKVFNQLSEKDRSDTILIQFIAGKWDNHSGNILITDANEPVLIDNEDMQTLQQVRYGEFPFLKRGQTREELRMNPPGPFPFDSPMELKDPSFETLTSVFGHFYSVEGIERIYKKIPSLPNRTVRYAIWDGALWVSNARTWNKPAYTPVYSKKTLRALHRLNAKVLTTQILLPSFTVAHVDGVLDRVRQVLEASKRGRLIP